MATGYWTEGKIENGVNVGGGTFVEGPNLADDPAFKYGAAGRGEYDNPYLEQGLNAGVPMSEMGDWQSAGMPTTWNSDNYFASQVNIPVGTTVNAGQLGSQPIGALGASLGANYASKVYGDNAGLGKIDPTTGLFVLEDKEDKEEKLKKEKTQKDFLKEALDMYEGEPEVNSEAIRSQAERETGVNTAKQQMQNTQAAINAVTAKMNADLLHLRDVGSREGVTEAVYGGQQAVVTREATIKLLPLQAQLAFDQGNFQMAQERTDDLFKLRFEDATKKADRWRRAAERGYDNFTKAEQKKIDDIDQTYKDRKSEVSDLRNYAQGLSNTLLQNGQKDAYAALTTMNFPDVTSTNYDSQMAALKSKIAQYGSQYAPKETATKEPGPLNILDVQRYNELYPDAGVVAGDTETQANAKIAASNTPEAKTRSLVVAAQANGADYATVVKEIKNDATIKDKTLALKIADEVYGQTEIAAAKQPPQYGQGQFSKVEINERISSLSRTGLPQNQLKALLKKDGYSPEAIRKAGVGNIIDDLTSFLFGE